MTIKTRKPTGLAPWPMLLLAGKEKSGKSYAAAVFSASDLIDRTFYIEIGEGSADQYGALPGARYELVEHDGSYASILAACEAAVAEPTTGKPHAIVLDSMTELWGLLVDEQSPELGHGVEDVVTMDQWNAAKKRWRKIIDTLRSSRGPVILTARYDRVSVVEHGKPKMVNGEAVSEWKVRAEKELAYEVDGVITMTEPRNPFVAGMRTVALNIPKGGLAPKDPETFSLDKFLRSLNIDGAPRTYIPRKEDPNAFPEPVTEKPIALDEFDGPNIGSAAS